MKVRTVKKWLKDNGASFWKVCVVIEAENDEDESMMYARVTMYHRVMAEVPLRGVVTVNQMVNVLNETCFTAAKLPGIYMFREFFVNCPSVVAILTELEAIRDGVVTPNLRHTQGTHILSLLEALDKLWD